MSVTSEQEEIAVRALLDVAGDRTVRPSMRIAAARSVLSPPYTPDVDYEDDEPEAAATAAEDVSEEIYDTIAERVMTKLRPVLEQLGAKP